jgi:hypothetical protein
MTEPTAEAELRERADLTEQLAEITNDRAHR